MNKLVLGALALSLTGGCADGGGTPKATPDAREVREEVLACGEDPCLGLSEAILAKVGDAIGSVPSVTDGCRRKLAENVAECMAVVDSYGGNPGLRNECIDHAAENVESICGE